MLLDKNGREIVAGSRVWAVPDGGGNDQPRVMLVTEVTGSGQLNDVEVLDAADPRVQSFFQQGGFTGGGGTFGGGGASGSW